MAHKRTATRAGILAPAALLGGLWWLIAAGRPDAWLIGVPAVALAVLASTRLGGGARPRLSPAGLPGFIALFLRESLAGGLDVARRTLGRQLRIQPGFGSYRTRLQDPRARVLLVNCISLLPGTLAAGRAAPARQQRQSGPAVAAARAGHRQAVRYPAGDA
jgi:multicomponent Na+:H+ antiporter subunit E